MRSDEPIGEARFAYEGLDRVIHERARLGILTSLAARKKGVSFGDLKQLCGLTDGNLNRHLKVLEEKKMVQVVKTTAGNRPQTICRITASGRARFVEYLATLEKVVKDAAAMMEDSSMLEALRAVSASKA
jgi:predicted ArsR family transcriptional regulator